MFECVLACHGFVKIHTEENFTQRQRCWSDNLNFIWYSDIFLAPVVQRVDSAIQWINYYPLDNAINFDSTYPLDSDLSNR